jgi:hypothetical protein
VVCPRCLLELPERARYCARCGTRLQDGAPARDTPPGFPTASSFAPAAPFATPIRAAPPLVPRKRPRPPLWLLLLFWVGSVIPLFFGFVYGLIAIDPGLGGGSTGLSPVQVQQTAIVITVCCLLLLGLQLVAAGGLTGAQSWGRIIGTIVCVAWAFTCIGIPVAVLALGGIWWRRRPAPTPGM